MASLWTGLLQCSRAAFRVCLLHGLSNRTGVKHESLTRFDLSYFVFQGMVRGAEVDIGCIGLPSIRDLRDPR